MDKHGNAGPGSVAKKLTPKLPDSIANAERVRSYLKEDLPDKEALDRVLQLHGIDTRKWGSGPTKQVYDLWKELNQDEALLEVWRLPSGQIQVYRSVHVLRGKVCSLESFKKNVFLLNTKQQYGSSGQFRVRNGLMSEKLTCTEMSEKHLNVTQVCQRAMNEEFEQVGAADCWVKNGEQPEYDPLTAHPIKVKRADLIDHTIELVPSPSFPGLTTWYNLYTCDIICEGLPRVDFNTLEYIDGADGRKHLKWIHAWVWLTLAHIERYLVKGSEMKERKQKGSFRDVKALGTFLQQFDLQLDRWNRSNGVKSIGDLFDELENEESFLEVWSREDGMPILLRVVHVMQLQLYADTPHRTLLQVSQQTEDSEAKPSIRLLAKQLKLSSKMNDQRFLEEARETVKEYMSHLRGSNFHLPTSMKFEEKGKDQDTLDGLPRRTNSSSGLSSYPLTPMEKKNSREAWSSQILDVYSDLDDETSAQVEVVSADYVDQRGVVEMSQSYHRLNTMYHLYCIKVKCKGIPSDDFTSLVAKKGGIKCVGWRWVSWQEALDILNARIVTLEREDHKKTKRLGDSLATLDDLDTVLKRVMDRVPEEDADALEAAKLVENLKGTVGGILSVTQSDVADHLPTGILANSFMTHNNSSNTLIQGNLMGVMPNSDDAFRNVEEVATENGTGNGPAGAAAPGWKSCWLGCRLEAC